MRTTRTLDDDLLAQAQQIGEHPDWVADVQDGAYHDWVQTQYAADAVAASA